MTDYLIQSTKKFVSANRIINGQLEAIKIAGESQFPLAIFWSLFKQKIEYEAGEQLAFVVLSGDESFEFDPEIMIAATFISTTDELSSLIFEYTSENINLITSPPLDINKLISVPSPQIALVEPEPELRAGSLQSYFREKTREIQRENTKVTGGT